jgi:hypothetical protein
MRIMLWTTCGCGPGGYHRVHRASWMRWLFPARRLYRCAGCKEQAFVPMGQALGPDAEPPPLQTRRRAARVLLARLLLGSVLAGLVAITAGTWWNAYETHSAGIAAKQPVSGLPVETCRTVHVFRDGETLESIARDELGAEWRWQDIAAANPGLIDKQMLQDKGFEPGMRLQLPADCKSG